MAIFHLNAHPVSRGKGQSAIAKAAYNSRTKLEDERTGLKKDYSRMEGVQFSGIFAPKDAPEWAKDRQQLWNEVERREDQSNHAEKAQLAREIRIGLPHELTEQQREWLVKDWVREQLVRKGMVADVNIHEPHSDGDDRNYHAHILVTMREIGPDGFGLKAREWNSKAQLEQWRESWEHMANKQLERHGHDVRIDRRTLEEQGIEREPTTHRGPQVDGIERRGVEADNSRQNADNAAELAQLRAALSNINRDIAAERNERAAEASATPRQVQRPAPVIAPKPERELNETSSQIRLAYALSDSAAGFSAALEERGIRLAVVNRSEAEQSKTDSATAKEQGRYVPEYRAGEIVAITGVGRVYRLNEHTTGDARGQIEKFLGTLDRRQLDCVELTQQAQMTEAHVFSQLSRVNSLSAEVDASPIPANDNQIINAATDTLHAVPDAMEAAPAEALNLVNETAAEIAGGFKTVAAALSIFDPDQPVIPPTKEIAANMQIAAAADRRAHIERMLTDRAYKNEQEIRAREERERQAQREEEYQRTRQRY
jgi:MobA/MobL family